ncbi:MAG: hypothetical protein Q9201_001248 [Fulgogasparrea decipioides]
MSSNQQSSASYERRSSAASARVDGVMKAFCQDRDIDFCPSTPLVSGDPAEHFSQPPLSSSYFQSVSGEELSKELVNYLNDNTTGPVQPGPAQEDLRHFLRVLFIDPATDSVTCPKRQVQPQTSQVPFSSSSGGFLSPSKFIDMFPAGAWADTQNSLPAGFSGDYEDLWIETPTFFTTLAIQDKKQEWQKSTLSKSSLPQPTSTQKRSALSNANSIRTQNMKSSSKPMSSAVSTKATPTKSNNPESSRIGKHLIQKQSTSISIGLGVRQAFPHLQEKIMTNMRRLLPSFHNDSRLCAEFLRMIFAKECESLDAIKIWVEHALCNLKDSLAMIPEEKKIPRCFFGYIITGQHVKIWEMKLSGLVAPKRFVVRCLTELDMSKGMEMRRFLEWYIHILQWAAKEYCTPYIAYVGDVDNHKLFQEPKT